MPAAKDWHLFCTEFVRLGGTLQMPNGKATSAAKACGYTDRSATNQAHRLLRKPEVRQLIDDLVRASVAKSVYQIPSADEILERIDLMAKNGKSEITKLRALELLGRYRALFQDRVAIDMPKRIVIKDDHGETITELG